MKNEFFGFRVITNQPRLLVVPVTESFKDLRDRYENSRIERDEIVVYAEILTHEEYVGINGGPSVSYHLFDFTSSVHMRGVYPIIQTFPFIMESIPKAVAMHSNNALSLHALRGAISFNSKHMVKAIKFIEEQLVRPKDEAYMPLFSRRKDWMYFYYGLRFKLDEVLQLKVPIQQLA